MNLTNFKGDRMNKDGKIGIFDSGIGGVTVLKEIIKILPKEDYIYYSDSINNPYGDKTEAEILKICDKIVTFFLEKKCKIIIIACNTASAKASNYLRNKYKEIPIIAIEPAYKMVYDFAYDDPTLVMATQGTIESEKFNLLYKKYNNNKTIIMPCIGLADLIENEKYKEINIYLMEKIGKYKGKINNVVLGCTHYPLIKNEIKNVLGKVKFFDGAENVAKHLSEILKENNILNNGKGKVEFMDSQGLVSKKNRFLEILYNFDK